MIKPNLFICGVHKGGTTSLHNYLHQHPKIFMSADKEPRYFSLGFPHNYGKGPIDPVNTFQFDSLEKYLSLFDTEKPASYFGESSTLYMYDRNVPKRIFEHNPHSKIIVIIRNPFERIISNYLYNVQNGIEKSTLLEALQSEQHRIKEGWGPAWHYRLKSLYSCNLELYNKFFGQSLKVIQFENFKSQPLSTINEIFSFLEIGPHTIDVTSKYNVTHKPKSTKLNRFMRRINRYERIYKYVPQSVRRKLKSGINSINVSNRQAEISLEDKQASIGFLKEELNQDLQKVIDLCHLDLKHWFIS